MRYFMELAYRGARYHGWQTQPGEITVQSAIEDALAKLLRRQVKITGAGRTDTGVNASMMVAHLDLLDGEPLPGGIVRGINAIVGRDIAVYGVTPVADDAHARFDATSRTYHYYTHRIKSPFIHSLSWQAPPALDYEAMNRAAALLLDVADFTSFAKLHSDSKTNICRVSRAEWIDAGDGRMVFVITADRFLRNMVRAVTGTLVDVGRGKLTIDDFAAVIAARDRCAAGVSMPPEPLFLHSIQYPYYSSVGPSLQWAY